MSKVFEALQRQQQNEKGKNENGKEDNRDPLAHETGALDTPAADESPGIEMPGIEIDDNAGMNFELPPIIGAPSGPRSNEGVITSSPSASVEEQKHKVDSYSYQNRAPLPKTANGKIHRPQTEVDQEELEKKPQAEKHKPPTPAEVPREIRIEQLVRSRLHPRLILLTDPEAAECEQYRTLRTELFHAVAIKRTQVVTVTSALVGEGKTSTVLNLALAIAQSREKKVLVIDGDLRRPNVASYLGLRPSVGLGEVLKGDSEIFSSVFFVDEQELYILPVNKEADNPTELLSSERFPEMIAMLRGYFDFILIDSPPVMPFADSRLLANYSDSLIMVVRAGLAPYETVEKAIDALPRGRILGVVLNGAIHIKDSEYYDSYYNYARREQRRRSVRERIANKIRKGWVGNKTRL